MSWQVNRKINGFQIFGILNVLIWSWKLSPRARYSPDICEGIASPLRNLLQAGQRDNCTEVRESATKGIVCSFPARAFLLLIIEDLKQLLVFILKALQFTLKKPHLLAAFCWLTLTP